jgi:hypothetical protein
MIRNLFVITWISFVLFNLNAQTHADQVVVDTNGVMRWSADNNELHGFGVNYTLPFAHEYRMAVKAGASLEEAVRQDVYHMARLDLDLYRIHIWDTEISDTLGNLINNDHLRLFDFTVNEMKKRGMHFIITPISYWGDGWPEPDEATPGFSQKYGKAACLTNSAAIDAQANYLFQFLNHVNPYTGLAYKDDPYIIGFEINNEPHHSGPHEQVTAFIDRMVSSMRKTGCTKPIFYNMSHSIYLAGAYFKAQIQGGTFQWYPTNLVAGHQINGNFLRQVETYRIPFAGDPGFKKMARIVYEFDPADVGGNILYPAMARAFRESGMQLAAQFAYDAMCWATYNTNYGTHFMNLAYAPNKAISLKIASAVFHQVPMYEKHADGTRFDGFRISYPEDLVEWVTNEKFFYSNNTGSQPENASQLKEIAGCGSSPLVKYSGTGAYFLDKLSDGIWRLEIMPDAWWIDDPYGPVDPGRQKGAVMHTQRHITVSLPNLGKEYSADPINPGNTFTPNVVDGRMEVIPGVYLLKRKDVKADVRPDLVYKNIRIDEYVAPASDLDRTVIWNHTPAEVVAGKPLQLQFDAVSNHPVTQIEVNMNLNNSWKTMKAVPSGSYSYQVSVPENMTEVGFLNYRIIVETSHDTTTFPGSIKGDPWNWKNSDRTSYSLRIVPDKSPLVLWNAGADWDHTYKIWDPAVNLKPEADGKTALAVQLPQLPQPDPDNQDNRSYAFKFYFGDKIKGRSQELSQMKYLVVKASNMLSVPQPLEIGLIDKNGNVHAGVMMINPGEHHFRMSLDTFSSAPFLIIPRPFPDFLPYQVQPVSGNFDWSSLEVLQLIIKQGKQANVDLYIKEIELE